MFKGKTMEYDENGLPKLAKIKERKKEPKPEPTPIEKTINALNNLRSEIYGNKMLNKYLVDQGDDKKLNERYLDANGHIARRKEHADGYLTESDHNEIVNKIINAINLSKSIKPEEDKEIRIYLNSILNSNKYFSDGFDDFVDSLNISKLNGDPYTFSRNKKPNILSNISLYLDNPNMTPKIYTADMIEGKSIERIVNDNIVDGKDEEIRARNEILEEKLNEINQINDRLQQAELDATTKDQLIKEKDKLINELTVITKQQQTEINILRKFNKDITPTVNEFNQIKVGVVKLLNDSKVQSSDLKELLERNQTKKLDDAATGIVGDRRPIKSRIDSIREQLAAKGFDQNEINQIIAKALSKEEHYKRVVAANQDLFDRDMSQDTIQNENEQFQSKLRQQNLRYILPAFVERRDKLVENTLNPNLLKGAFAI